MGLTGRKGGVEARLGQDNTSMPPVFCKRQDRAVFGGPCVLVFTAWPARGSDKGVRRNRSKARAGKCSIVPCVLKKKCTAWGDVLGAMRPCILCLLVGLTRV